MKDQSRKVLESLRAERTALKGGGYEAAEGHPWRARYVFEDGPCCLRRGPGRQGRCAECALMELVPKDQRREKFPCRFIPLNASGDTVDSFYRCGTEEELEAAMATWLDRTIDALEETVDAAAASK